MRARLISFTATVLMFWAAGAPAQDANYDSATFDRETAKIEKLGKTALPVYSTKLGQRGSITMGEYAEIRNGKLMKVSAQDLK